jgi:hypothetical protein
MLPHLIISHSKTIKWRTLAQVVLHSVSSEPFEFVRRTNPILCNIMCLLNTSPLHYFDTPMVAHFMFVKRQSECHSTYDVREVSTDWGRIRKDEFQVSILKCWNVCAALSYKLSPSALKLRWKQWSYVAVKCSMILLSRLIKTSVSSRRINVLITVVEV